MKGPRHSQVSPRTVWTVGLHGMLVVLLGLLVLQLTTVFKWLAAVLFLTLALDPAVRGLQRLRLKRGWAVLVVLLGLMAVFLLLVGTILPMLVNQVRSLIQAIPEFVEDLRRLRWVQWLDEHLQLMQRLEAEARLRAPGVAGPAVEVVTSVVGLVAAGITILSLTIFALLTGGELYENALDWLDPEDRAHAEALATQMRQAVGGYVAGTFAVASIGATVTALLLLVLGVPYFLPLGLTYLVLGIIPFIGSALAALLVSITTLLTVGFKEALIALGVFLVYQQVEGNILQPVVQRHTIKLNPLLIAIAVLMGAGIAGLPGTIMALPVAAAVQVILRDVHARRMELRKQPPEGGPPARGGTGAPEVHAEAPGAPTPGPH
jgi:putative heme transporter